MRPFSPSPLHTTHLPENNHSPNEPASVSESISPPPRQVSSPPPEPVMERSPSPVVPQVADYVSVEKRYPPGSSRPEWRYSLKPPPSWPPPRSEFPSGTDFRVLFDPALDKDKDGKAKHVINLVRSAMSSSSSGSEASSSSNTADYKLSDRLKQKGRDSEVFTLYRFAGETVEGEPKPEAKDPRKDGGMKRTKMRSEFHTISYAVRHGLLVGVSSSLMI